MAEVLIRPNAFAPFESGGLRANEIANSGFVALAPRRGARAQLASQIGALFGLAPPDGLGCAKKNGLTIIGTAPDSWLCIKNDGGDLWAGTFAAAVAGVGSVVDQTGAYVRVRLEGEQARAVLQKGAYVDLHPNVFGASAAAQTSIAHVNVLLWRPDDALAYEFAVPRSYILAFRHWLENAAAA